MFTFFQSDKFLFFCLKYQKLIFYFFVSLLVLGLWEGLIVSPQDYVQGNSVRIMYVHVPSAWISLGIFSVIGILSIFSFIICFFYIFLNLYISPTIYEKNTSI